VASIPLPALDVRTPQQPDLLEKFSQLQQLRGNQQAMQIRAQQAPLQQQQLEQGVQQGQIGLEQAQQGQKDQQAFRAAMQDPSLQGKTIGQVADALAQGGKISQASWVAAKKADVDQRSALAGLDEKNLANQKAAHIATQELYNNVMNMPDDQLAANWPQIAQQYDAIPGNNKQPLDPNKPLTKQQLSQFGPVISLGNAYFDQELARREAQAKATTAQQTADAGGTSDLAKYQQDWIKSHNLENTPENRQKAFQEYTKETKIAPAEVRAATYLQMPQAVFDPATGQNVYTTRAGAIGKEAPSSADALAAKAGVQADAASLKKLQSNYDNVTAFENTAGKNLDQFLSTAKSVVDTGSPFLNTPVRMITSQMVGSEKMAAFNAARQTAVSEIGKVLSSANAGSGVVSDSARHEVESLIGPNATLKQIYAAANILKKDMDNRKTAYQDQITEVKTRMGGGGPAPAPGATHRYNPQTGQIEAVK
jgi:hypothetical protein